LNDRNRSHRHGEKITHQKEKTNMVKSAGVRLDLQGLAFHEAGHAVVGLALGCVIEEIRVSSRGGAVRFCRECGPGRLSERLAKCSGWTESADPYLRDQIQRELMIHVAGWVAEDLWLKRQEGVEGPTLATSVCYRLSSQLARGVTPGRWRRSDLTSATLAARILDRLDCTGDHVLEAERRADILLRAEWDRVERLAHSLCRRGAHRQAGEQVDMLISPVPRWEPPA
jgi:hypothetical protein